MIFFREKHDFVTKIEKSELIPSEDFFFGFYPRIFFFHSFSVFILDHY